MNQISAVDTPAKLRLVPQTIWRIGFALFVFTGFTIALARTSADPDLWGHLRFGLDTLQAGHVIETDPYSYVTEGQRWINHELLAELSDALAWQMGGVQGLILLKLLIAYLTVGIIGWHLQTLGLRATHIFFLLILVGILPMAPSIGTVRPQIFTFLFYAVIVISIYRAERGQYSWLWLCPPTIVLWINSHGGVLAGLGILGIWTGLHLLFRRRLIWQVILPSLCSLAAIAVNPYFVELPRFLFETATVPRPEISDWQPLNLISQDGLLYSIVFAITVGGLFFTTIKRNSVLMLLLLIMAFLPWMAVRHIPLFSLTAAVFCGEHISSALNKLRNRPARNSTLPLWFALLPWLITAVVLLWVSRQNLFQIRVDGDYFAVDSVEILKESGVAGNLATNFNWGEYIIWHLGPQIKVSMDGRRETVYPPSYYQSYLNFHFGMGEWDRILLDDPADMILISSGSATHNLIKLKPEWLPIYEDKTSALFVKQGSPLVEALQRAAANFTPSPEPHYFP